jgi:Arc/MetJ family transcription regulator
MNTRTNVVIDDKLINKAMLRAGVKTKRAAIEAALRAFVREPDYAGMLALYGTGGVAEGYDPKASSPPRAVRKKS